MQHLTPTAFLDRLFQAAVARAQATHVTAPFLPEPPKGRTVVIGAGKASAAMAMAVEAHWPADAPLTGLVITRYGHIPENRPKGVENSRIRITEAAHPVPDAAGVKATAEIVELLQGLGPDDLVLALISGGGSSLLVQPAKGLTLAKKQAINKALLASGAAIDEINCVRKHLSAIKGGRLAALAAPAKVVTLMISDVPGDDPATIASGPTVPDASTCAQALEICQRYQIALPAAIQKAWENNELETPKPGDKLFESHEHHLIATPLHSLKAAAAYARSHGVAAHILSDAIEGESRDVGKVHAALARSIAAHDQPFERPCVLLSGGETTVTVQAKKGVTLGQGGRASEFLLGCAIALQGTPDVYVLAADTDGIDGVQDNAGAIVTPDTLKRASELGMNAYDFQNRHDAYHFFAALNDLVITGPTYTNVNDFRAVYLP